MKAGEARELMRMAQQERALERQKQEEDHAREIQELVDMEIEEEIEELDLRIRDACQEGQWEIVSKRDKTERGEALVERLAEHYRGEGFMAKWLAVKVGSVPSMVELRLTSEWRK